MSLFDDHKAERRTRILTAARRLVSERGYAGVTMRDLARAAKVSVPTLYNLFGGKDQILCAEVANGAARVAVGLPGIGESFFTRGTAAFEASMKLVEDAPEFYRAVMQMFLTSPETTPMRKRIEDAHLAVMAGNLSAAKAAGQLADWAEPAIVARHMFALYMSCFLAWGLGELDLATFRACAFSGCCHLLVGVARGPFLVECEARIRELARDPLLAAYKELAHAIRV